MDRVLVTGANGFVGRRLVQRLRSQFEVIGLDRAVCAADYPMITCDITSRSAIEEVLGHVEIDHVVHCAAIAHNDRREFSEADFLRVNVDGTQYLVDVLARRPIRSFVLFSSVAVYGERDYDGSVTEDHPLAPNTPYGRSKALAEKACFEKPDFPAVVLRFPPIYAPGFLKDLRKRIFPTSSRFAVQIGSGANQYSFCSIENACEAVTFVLENHVECRRRVFHVTDGTSISNLGLRQYLMQVSRDSPVLHVPKGLVRFGVSLAGAVFPSKREYLRSVYWKLAEDNVYSMKTLMGLSFRPVSKLHGNYSAKCQWNR